MPHKNWAISIKSKKPQKNTKLIQNIFSLCRITETSNPVAKHPRPSGTRKVLIADAPAPIFDDGPAHFYLVFIFHAKEHHDIEQIVGRRAVGHVILKALNQK